MDLSVITDEDRINHFDNVLIALVGGESVFQMLAEHHEGRGWQEIADVHGVPRSTVRGWVGSAKVKLREAGLLDARQASEV